MVSSSGFDFNLFRAMEVFAAVVETRQVTRAAKLLGITQSAASQHIKSLEDALGTRLLDRAVKPIEPTRAGMSLHRRAVRVLNEIEDLKTDVRRLDSAPLPLLRIGMLASIATTLTPSLIDLTRARFAVPEIALYAGLASDHQNLLRNRRADMVVTSDALYDVEGLQRHAILREQFLLVLPPDDTGPSDDLIQVAARYPLVRFAAEAPVGRRTDQHLARVRLALPRVIEADRASMVVAAVSAGQGFALLTPTLLLDALAEGMRFTLRPLPIAGFSRSLTLVARERELGNLAQTFAISIRDTLQQGIDAALPDLPPGTVSYAD